MAPTVGLTTPILEGNRPRLPLFAFQITPSSAAAEDDRPPNYFSFGLTEFQGVGLGERYPLRQPFWQNTQKELPTDFGGQSSPIAAVGLLDHRPSSSRQHSLSQIRDDNILFSSP